MVWGSGGRGWGKLRGKLDYESVKDQFGEVEAVLRELSVL